MRTTRPNAAAKSRRAFRLRVAGDLSVAPALYRRSPAAVAELVSAVTHAQVKNER